MTATIENVEKNQVKLTITVDAETFGKAVQAAYLKNRGRIAVPGFRKGKAPRNVIEQYYGKEVFYSDAIDAVYEEAYTAAVAEHNVEPVDMPAVDIVSIDENGFVFTATVEVKPEVVLGQYKGVEVTRVTYTVPESMVDADIEATRARQARFVAVERAAALGDTVLMNYAGTVDGVAFAGGTADDQTLELGSGRFIPGFEDQLVGVQAGQEVDVNVTFPTEYHAEDLAGKDAVFHVVVKEVQEKQLPELDDEFVKDISDECDTLQEYRASVRARLEKEASDRADNDFDNDLLTAVVANTEIEIPNAMIERQIDALVRDMEQSMSYQGISLDMFIQYTGTTMEEIRNRYRAEAERRVKSQLVFEAIIAAEGIEATDEDIDSQIVEFAQSAQQDVEEIRAKVDEQQRAYIAEDVAIRKTFDLLRAEAVITDVEKVYGAAEEAEEEADAE
ncbi:MAG: trigger factor [Clostridia bacterium]|nr:trigger factor [Clostridia bacterium]